MCKYVSIEDVQKIISDYKYHNIRTITQVQTKINSLPTISPESMIEEMIEKENSDWKSIYNEKELILLFAILQRFKS